MKFLPRFAALLFLAVLLQACVGQTMRIGPIKDTTDIDRSRGRRISAQASGFQLFGVLPTTANTRHERAWQALREQAGNDAIAEVTVRESWSYALLGTVYTTCIEAMAYPRISRPNGSSPE